MSLAGERRLVPDRSLPTDECSGANQRLPRGREAHWTLLTNTLFPASRRELRSDFPPLIQSRSDRATGRIRRLAASRESYTTTSWPVDGSRHSCRADCFGFGDRLGQCGLAERGGKNLYQRRRRESGCHLKGCGVFGFATSLRGGLSEADRRSVAAWDATVRSDGRSREEYTCNSPGPLVAQRCNSPLEKARRHPPRKTMLCRSSGRRRTATRGEATRFPKRMARGAKAYSGRVRRARQTRYANRNCGVAAGTGG